MEKEFKVSVFNFDKDAEWEQVDPLIRRKILAYSKELMMLKVEFKTGGIGTLHSHPHLQISYVESGSFEVHIENETRILNKNDVYYIPSGQVHGVKCLDNGVLIDVFNPMREDFLKN